MVCSRSGRVTTIAILAFAALASACGGSTEPRVPTDYSLVTIDGVALPAPDKSSPGAVISAGSIDFIGSDSADVRETSFGGTAIRLDHVYVDRNGSALVFLSSELRILPDTAALDGTSLTVQHHVLSVNGPVVEVRVYTAR